LMDVNDPIRAIEGQISGTLGFICGRLDEELPFSRALAEAKAKGYTEPDPREDLGGLDARRKLLILGRMAGWPMEEGDIEIEQLYPRSLAHLTVPEFMAAAVAIDPSLRDRVAAAKAEGQILRYVAHLAEGKGKVGLTPIPQSSPLANLKYISFRTGFYDSEPLLLGGKGAGVGMTAAGVLGDMIGLAREIL
jgi:homoserine dehydrogenase